MHKIAILAVLFAGCADVGQYVDAVQTPLNTALDAQQRVRAGIVAVCAPDPRPAQCADLIAAFNEAVSAENEALERLRALADL